MDMSLSKLREMVKVREAWHAADHGAPELDMIEQLNSNNLLAWEKSITSNQEKLWPIFIYSTHLLLFFSRSHVRLFVVPWTAAWQAPLSFTVSQSLLKFTFIELVVLYNHLILCRCFLLWPSIFPIIKVSIESAFHIRWSKYWSFSISSMNIQGWFSLGLTGFISLESKGLSRVPYNTTDWQHQFFSIQPSLWSNSHVHTRLLEKP